MALQLAERRCESCGAPLPTTARRDRRYCGGACRARASAQRRREAQAAAGTAVGAGAGLPPELRAALDRALAEPLLVGYVARAAQSNWRAAAFILERRYPERWSPGRTSSGEPPDLTADPFNFVDELAARRREQLRPPS